MKVLIVDDTAFMRMTIRKILEENGMNVVAEAVDGVEAIAKFKKYNPDLTIMDISMPRMDGLEAVTEIMKINNKASIIMCSLQGQRSNVLDAIKAGAKSYLVKPVKEEKLLREIQKLQFSGSTSQAITKNLLAGMVPHTKERVEVPVEPLPDTELNHETESAPIIEPITEIEPSTEALHSEDFILGLKQGYLESKREIVTNMIRAGIPMVIITDCVALSEEEVLTFKEAYNL